MPSNYFSRLSVAFRQGVQKSVVRQEGGLNDTLVYVCDQGKLLFGNSRFFHSEHSGAATDLHAFLRSGTVAAAQLDLHLVNRRKNLSVVAAISRTFSVPSVSGPSFQVCGYHIDRLLSEPSQIPLGIGVKGASMATCSSKSFVADCKSYLSLGRGNPTVSMNSCDFSKIRNFDIFRKASSSLRNTEQPNSFSIYGYVTYNSAKRRSNSNPYQGFGSKGFHTSSPECFSAGIAPYVSFDNSAREEHLASSADSCEQKIMTNRVLRLYSASCYLPHPDKEETGGEDAHFICSEEQAVGVADGVGGWADLGVDAGQYARELMSNSVNAIQDEPKGSVDPARVLEKAHSKTKARGSSTACIIALTDQGLHAINLGDSGFMVVRDGCTVFRSPVQQHDFNFTYQLESGNNGDLPSSGQVFSVPVAPGDVIIAGTDGLFDNLYNNDITAVVVHAVRAGLGPQVTAQKIAALARQRAQDKNRQTPFSAAAQDAGFRYYGGKLDDITVVVSYITSANNESS